ncbi:MAG: efflux RND transporter permease subunit [Gammaproteobacteria bacterium]|nr:efflux RND transporter permease subunit [Gammaproteobacteria bacterium]MBQ0840556.1 efflux RND transporter permease subunit [Gammaproteobacteria bacterium]
MSKPRLNPAGLLASIFVQSKITALFVIACLLLGVVAVIYTPREENPQIVVPGAHVILSLPGASPQEVEQLLMKPLEKIVKQITGVDHVYSTSMNSVGILMVQFEVGEDKQLSLVKLYDQVLGQRDKLPPETPIPLIKSIDVDTVPIVTVTLASTQYDDYQLKRVADRVLEGLHSLKTVSATYVRGGRDREINIEVDPGKVKAFNVSLDQVRIAVQTANLSLPLDAKVLHNQLSRVMFKGQLSSADEIRTLIVGTHNQRPVYLSDVATIVDGPSNQRDTLSRFAFGQADPRFDHYPDPEIPAVTLAVAKITGSNAVFMADEVLARIEIMKKTTIPADIEVVVTRNDGKKANDAVNLLIENLGIALLSVFVITVFFLGWKEASIVGLAVPLILALTLGADYLFGPTINRVTLFALILALGMLVDGAIVVVENIHRHYATLNNGDKAQATILATNEIGNPTNLATFAVMLVFASQFILSGMVGQYFYPLAFNVPIAMFASVIIAYIVTPWACFRWLKVGHTGSEENSNELGDDTRLSRFFEKILSPLLANRTLRLQVFALIIIAIALATLQPAWQFIRPAGITGPQSALGVELAMLPRDSKNTFNITIDMPENTAIELTDQIAREVGGVLREHPYITNYQTWIGQSGVIDFNGLLRGSANKRGPHVAEIRVNLIDKHDRSPTSITIVRELRTLLAPVQANFPGSLIQLVEEPPGPPMQATVLAEIYGRDLAVMEDIAHQVSTAFESTYDVVEVHDSLPDTIEQYHIVVDQEKAALSGINPAQVATLLRRISVGEDLGRIHIEGERQPVPIKMMVPRRFNIEPEGLPMYPIANAQGHAIPLSELTRVEKVTAEKPISRKDFERVIYVAGELTESAPLYAILHINKQLENIVASDGHPIRTGLNFSRISPNTLEGYRILWDGEIRLTLDTYNDMLKAFGLAVMFIFILLIAYYQSFKIPLIAMSAIPLGLIGVFPGHWIMGQSFTATSIIGIIALAGIVVRNSLLIIDFVLDLRKEGKSLHDAIMAGTLLRLRPILLTALSTILGSGIMISDPIFGGLAISLIYGTVVSTFLTVIVVPLLFYQFLLNEDKRKNKALEQ